MPLAQEIIADSCGGLPQCIIPGWKPAGLGFCL